MAEEENRAYEESKKYIEDLTSQCDKVQVDVLAEILSQNAETEYLKRFGLPDGCVDRDMFKSLVPIVGYDDIKSDILRIYNGDFSPILTAQPITELWLSSGTSSDGQQKLIPMTLDSTTRLAKLSAATLPFITYRIAGPEQDKGKVFTLLLTQDEIITPGGLLARSALTSIYKNPKVFKDRPYPHNINTSPIEAIHCSDHFQSIYTQLLCAFYQRQDVTRFKSFSASNLVWAIHFLKRHYTELCHDISSGQLSPKIVDPFLRARMIENFLHRPEPELATFIGHACMAENWEGIFKMIWPNIKYVETIVTGSMAQYVPILNYYSGGLPLISVHYSSSECKMGYNLNPTCDPCDICYTIMPDMAYYEFIPIKSSSEDDGSGSQFATVDMANVEVGQEYEIVITTFNGLYRYRVGDVLCPTRFYNSTPQFKFVRRRNVLLSLDADKTNELELQNAVDKVSKILENFDAIVFDYTSNANVKTVPGHYVIYLELMINENQEKTLGSDILEQCCLAMEDSLGYFYRLARIDESAGPLEIRVVSNGTFDKLRDYAISRGASSGQFKVPRCVKSLPMLELLESRVVSSHFSPSTPCR